MNAFIKIKPMIKGRPRFGKGFAYTPKRTRDYEKKLKELLTKLQMDTGWWRFDGAISVEIHFKMLMPKKPANKYPSGDLDNYVKAFLDAANEVLFLDDKQIVLLNASKCYVTDPMCEGIFFQVRSE